MNLVKVVQFFSIPMVLSLKEFSLARYSDTAVYANKSVLDINLLGEGFDTDGGALECHTDNTTCCTKDNGTAAGEWYYPNGNVIEGGGTFQGDSGFYRTRGHMVIRLNRRMAQSPTGEYRCVIPGAGGVNITRYVTLRRGVCSDLPPVNDTQITYSPPRHLSVLLRNTTNRYSGTIAVYSCSSWYHLVRGSSMRVCGPEGVWNGTQPACELGDSVSPSTVSEFPTPLITNTMRTTGGFVSSTTNSILDTFSQASPTTDSVDTPTILKTLATVVCSSISVTTIQQSGSTLISMNNSVDTPGSSSPTILKTSVTVFATNSSSVATTQSGSTPILMNDSVIVPSIVVVFLLIILVSVGAITALLVYKRHKKNKTNKQNRRNEIPLHSQYQLTATECSTGECRLKDADHCEEIAIIKEEHSSGNGGIRHVETIRSVPVSQFGEFVSQHHAQRNKKFNDNFETLDKGEQGHTVNVSCSEANIKANRYKNITVYDDNRIVLQPLPNSQSGYINACYVNGYSCQSKFIATQGPLLSTVLDFWRLVWQERPSAIVMLTNTVEIGRVKCEEYWPESGSMSFVPFHVVITDKQILADYTVRSFVINNTSDGRSLELTQFHFTTWPDHGVPDSATPLLVFLHRIRAFAATKTGPLLLHCSAGVGRTGTYLTLDNVLDQIKTEGVVDIDGVIIKARNQRMKMVQTKEQYIFIHDAILEFLTCGDTQISSTNFRVTMDKLSRMDPSHLLTGYQQQFKVLDQVSPSPSQVNCFTALKHKDKNRGNKYLPSERYRIILFGEHPDYINAVTASGYKQQKAFIIAQNPLESTIRNFWKLVTDQKCGAVVMLSQLVETGENVCAVYWPEKGTECYGEFEVELAGMEKCSGFIIRNITVNDRRRGLSQQVAQFHVTSWSPNGSCSNLKAVIDVIEEVTEVQKRTENKPVLVHCSDTVSRSGMFCTLATVIDRFKTEGVVDVFQVVKALRVRKPGAILTVEQYKLVYEAVLVFLA